jgi:cytochrome b pre-mRNA-processing protein 3
MPIRPRFRRVPRDTIDVLYGTIVAQARLPTFYLQYGVPDTVNGRFDMIVLHVALVLRRLSVAPAPSQALGQEIFARFCRDMDHNLREMGVGDLAVPKHMQRVAEAFFGRAKAYESALAGEEAGALTAALARNVHGGSETPGAVRLASYVRVAERHLAGLDTGALAQGDLSFPDPEAVAK